MAISQSTVGGATTAVLNYGHNAWIDGLMQLSVFVWAAINQLSSVSGHDNFMMAKRSADGAGTGLFIVNATTGGGGTNNNIEFTANNWGTTEGDWSWDGAQDLNFHAHLVTYNYGSTSNVPSYYLDGVAKSLVLTSSSPVGSLTGDSTNLTVGGEGSGHTKSFGGSIAHAAIWSAVLTPLEARLLADGVPPLLIRPDALVFYCPCSGDPAQALDLGRAQLGMASVTGTWLPADDPRGLLLPARGEAPVAFSPAFQSLPYRRPNMPLYRR
jgi:hypothetical protein